MNTSELMQAMSDAGAPFQAILIAVRALEDRDATIASKRAVERDRKRRQRERDSHGTVTGQSEDNAGQPPVLDKEIPPRPPKEINPIPRGNISRARASQFPCPDGCEPQHWQDILANRKAKRLPLTQSAYEKLLRDIEKYTDAEWPPGRIWAAAAERGWAGIYDPRNRDQRNGSLQPHSDTGLRGRRPDPALDLGRIADAEIEAQRAAGYQETDFGAGATLPPYLTG